MIGQDWRVDLVLKESAGFKESVKVAGLVLDFAAATTTSVKRQSTEAVVGLATGVGLEAATGGGWQVEQGCRGLGFEGCFEGT